MISYVYVCQLLHVTAENRQGEVRLAALESRITALNRQVKGLEYITKVHFIFLHFPFNLNIIINVFQVTESQQAEHEHEQHTSEMEQVKR